MTDGAPGVRISAILLAAGQSKRLGRNKLLLPAGGETVIRRTVRAAASSAVSETLLVTGHEAGRVRAAVDGLPVRIVHNPRYAAGQSTSMIAGIEAASAEAAAYLFVPGDQPLLCAQTLDEMIGLYARGGGRALIVAPAFCGRRGAPTLFSAALRAELLAVRGDAGGRGILRRLEAARPEQVVFLPLGTDDIFLDVDTEADYARMLGRLGESSPG